MNTTTDTNRRITLQAIRYEARYRWYVARCEARRLRERLQLGITRRLPRWLVYWVLMVAYSRAWQEAGDKTPDELTFSEVVQPWEPK